ncbi:MAG: hypothetical protein K6B65_02430 [Bacilli bacterium]|nr:hypothetical protein [Bacilli bacterium]
MVRPIRVYRYGKTPQNYLVSFTTKIKSRVCILAHREDDPEKKLTPFFETHIGHGEFEYCEIDEKEILDELYRRFRESKAD